MKRKKDTAGDKARLDMLNHGPAVVHALACPYCGLRDDALFTLSLAGWDEQAYLEALWAHLGGASGGRG
jgi:hypothetical protein